MSKYEEAIQKLIDIGFHVGDDFTLDSSYIMLERTVKGHNTHRVTLEDHRWERLEDDFDPERDIGEWLIFSFLTDDERDYFGKFVETQYPLTLPEVHLIEELIEGLEEKFSQMLEEV